MLTNILLSLIIGVNVTPIQDVRSVKNIQDSKEYIMEYNEPKGEIRLTENYVYESKDAFGKKFKGFAYSFEYESVYGTQTTVGQYRNYY